MLFRSVLKCGNNLLPCHTGIYGKSLDTAFAQVVHLVFHQGDERSDDDAKSLLGKGRDLECDGLAATGRHQSQCVFAFTDTGNDLFLQIAERVISPVLS